MIKTKSFLHVNYLIGGLLGGLLAGGGAGILDLMLVKAGILVNLGGSVGDLLAVVFFGSIVIGVIFGILYREAGSVIWITLLVVIQLSFFWLGDAGASVLKEVLGIKGILGIMARQFGALVGGGIGALIDFRLLLPRIRARAGENMQSLEK